MPRMKQVLLAPLLALLSFSSACVQKAVPLGHGSLKPAFVKQQQKLVSSGAQENFDDLKMAAERAKSAQFYVRVRKSMETCTFPLSGDEFRRVKEILRSSAAQPQADKDHGWQISKGYLVYEFMLDFLDDKGEVLYREEFPNADLPDIKADVSFTMYDYGPPSSYSLLPDALFDELDALPTRKLASDYLMKKLKCVQK